MSNTTDAPTSNVTENSNQASTSSSELDLTKMNILNDIKVMVTIEIGRASIKIKDLLNLSKDSVIELDKNSGEPVDIYVNDKLISKGTIVTVNGKYCVKLISVPIIK